MNQSITIVIPTYKRIEYFKEAFHSVVKQKRVEDISLIIVEDFPETNTVKNELVSANKNNIKVDFHVNERNLGLFGNWNKVFSLANSEWISLLMDDDVIHPQYFDHANKLINLYGEKFDLIAFVPQKFESIADITPWENVKFEKHSAREIRIEDFYPGNTLGAPAGFLFKKRMFDKLNGFKEDLYPSSDFDFYIRLLKYGRIILISNLDLSFWRIVGNTSHNSLTQLQFCKQDEMITEAMIASSNIVKKLIVKAYSYERTVQRIKFYNLSSIFSHDEFIRKFDKNIKYNLMKLIILIYRFSNKVLYKIGLTNWKYD